MSWGTPDGATIGLTNKAPDFEITAGDSIDLAFTLDGATTSPAFVAKTYLAHDASLMGESNARVLDFACTVSSGKIHALLTPTLTGPLLGSYSYELTAGGIVAVRGVFIVHARA